MITLTFGDLHLGNKDASILDFLFILKEVKKIGHAPTQIVMVGDILDGLDKYQTQTYRQYPETLNLQRDLFRWLVELLKNEFKGSDIVWVVGNHEHDFKGSFFDYDLLRKEYPYLKIVREFVDYQGFYYIHQLGKGTRFGSVSGWTPSTVMRALSIISFKQKELKKDLKGLVTGHVHKVFDVVNVSGYKLVLLPSFLKSGKETGEDIMYHPTIVSIYERGNTTDIKVFSKPFSTLETIVSFNNIFNSFIRTNYRVLTTIDKSLKIKDFLNLTNLE